MAPTSRLSAYNGIADRQNGNMRHPSWGSVQCPNPQLETRIQLNQDCRTRQAKLCRNLPRSRAPVIKKSLGRSIVSFVEEQTRPFHFGNSRIVAFRKQLESLVASGTGLLRESEFIVGEGNRADGLVRIAASLYSSLIVMSARGSPAQLLWPIASQVVCRAHSPVLTVRKLCM